MKEIRLRQAALSLVLLVSWLLPLFCFSEAALPAAAISTDYPAQLMTIATKDNSKVLTEDGTADGSTLSVKALGNNLAPSWRFDRVGSDSKGTYFKLTNAESGRMLTPMNYSVTAGTSVIMYGAESVQSQHWYVVPVKQDRLGNDLYYKIVNYSDTNMALTQSSSGMTLAAYTGADNQLWLLNADGLQGFAGYCKNDNTGSIKAADIGGLFGEVVEVTTFADLKKYCESTTPYTIVVTKNISVTNLSNDSAGNPYCPDGRIYVRSNKTIIGSYAAHTTFNVQFCTNSGKGVGNNIIIKNFEMQHDAKSYANDSIVVYFGSGENLWVDHVTFTGHSGYNSVGTELDKFIACCYDADYCTISDCSFGLHEYGLILGYPDDSDSVKQKYDGYPCMSLISNKYYKTLTRGPGLMRWGYFHSLNNYVDTFSMAYTVHSGCDIFAENCYYANGGNVICDWNSITYAGAYAESGSKFSNCNRTVQGQGTASNPSYSKASTWRPKNNYDYISLTADNAKNYCSSYSGCQNSKDNMMYLRYAKKGVPSAGFSTPPDGPMGPAAPVPASFAEGSAYRIKNVNSGLYMQVAGAAAENGANIQQWGSDGTGVHDIWKLYSAGDGYYYIASCVGDGGTYVLDVAGKKADNGTNIDLYNYNGGTNQQFMIAKNSDGSFKILTRVSGEKSAVEVESASTASGANVQEWEVNGVNCQDWIFEAVTDPGCKMDDSLVYTFENANSGMMMEIVNAAMEENSNVQQWESNGFDCQKWTLKAFGSGNYYWIRSLQDEAYALKAEGSANGGNIDIVAYSSKDSAQLFRFTKNLDGTYSIITHASKDACLVEVAGASKEYGANVQQWEITGSACQKWKLTTEAKPVPPTEPPTEAPTPPPTEPPTEAPTTPPTAAPTEPAVVAGDVNGDGSVTLVDLVLFQKWLLAVPGTTLPNPDAADLHNDSVLNVFDLVLMKRLLVNQ